MSKAGVTGTHSLSQEPVLGGRQVVHVPVFPPAAPPASCWQSHGLGEVMAAQRCQLLLADSWHQ